MSLQPLYGGIEIGYLQGEADLAADSAAGLNLVDGAGLLFVKDLEGGLAHVEDEGATLVFGPHLERLEAEAVAIRTRQAVKGLGRQCDAQFHDRRIRTCG